MLFRSMRTTDGQGKATIQSFNFSTLILDVRDNITLQGANFKPSPCIPLKFLLRIRFPASTPCVAVPGSEEVPVQSRNFKRITIACFLDHG